MRYFVLLVLTLLTACAASPVGSPVKSPAHSPVRSDASAEVEVFTRLEDLVSSTIVDLDASLSESTANSQQWQNLTLTPASGDTDDYNFYRGSSADDDAASPTLTNDQHFAMSTSVHFESLLTTTSCPTFWKNMHKKTAGNAYWIAYAMYYGSTSDSGVVFETWQQSSGVKGEGLTSQVIPSNNPENIHHGHRATAQNIIDVTTFMSLQDTVVIISWDADTDNIRVWMDTQDFSDTDASVFGTATNDAECNPVGIGYHSLQGSWLPSGTKLYALSMGNSYLTDAQALMIRKEYAERHKEFATNYTYAYADEDDGYEGIKIKMAHSNWIGLQEVRVTTQDDFEYVALLDGLTETQSTTYAGTGEGQFATNSTFGADDTPTHLNDNEPDITDPSSAIDTTTQWSNDGTGSGIEVYIKGFADKSIKHIDIAMATNYGDPISGVTFTDGDDVAITPTTSPSSISDTHQTTVNSNWAWFRWTFP
jgi:hypothetical protein